MWNILKLLKVVQKLEKYVIFSYMNEDKMGLCLKENSRKGDYIMKLFKRIAAAALIIVLSFSQISCSNSTISNNETQSTNNITAAATDSKAFNDFTDDLFAELAPQNTITLHSLVEHPENYGISNYEVTLGSYKTEDLDATSEYIDLLNKIKVFLHDFVWFISLMI